MAFSSINVFIFIFFNRLILIDVCFNFLFSNFLFVIVFSRYINTYNNAWWPLILCYHVNVTCWCFPCSSHLSTTGNNLLCLVELLPCRTKIGQVQNLIPRSADTHIYSYTNILMYMHTHTHKHTHTHTHTHTHLNSYSHIKARAAIFLALLQNHVISIMSTIKVWK